MGWAAFIDLVKAWLDLQGNQEEMGKNSHRATGHFFGLSYGFGYWVLFCDAFRGGFGANVVSHTDICRRSIGWAINCPQKNSRYLTGTEIVPRTWSIQKVI